MRIETNEEIAKRGTARIGDVNDMAKERSDDHSGGSDFFLFFPDVIAHVHNSTLIVRM